MPLDGSNFVPVPQKKLTVALAASGLRPVDRLLLDKHKVEQIRKNPPSFIYRHGAAIQFALPVGLAAGLLLVALLLYGDYTAVGVAVGLATLGLAAMALLLPVKRPAQWRERVIDDLAAVHPAIRNSAIELERRLPGVRFRLGELVQNRTVLDPYLIAEYDGDQAILGIWDGQQLIADAGA